MNTHIRIMLTLISAGYVGWLALEVFGIAAAHQWLEVTKWQT